MLFNMLRAEFTALLGVEIPSQANLSKMISGGAANQITGVMDGVDAGATFGALRSGHTDFICDVSYIAALDEKCAV
jgi:hypothetical protein